MFTRRAAWISRVLPRLVAIGAIPAVPEPLDRRA